MTFYMVSGHSMDVYRRDVPETVTQPPNALKVDHPYIRLLLSRVGRDGLPGRDGKDGEQGERGEKGERGKRGMKGN